MERSFDATVVTKNRQRLMDHDVGRALFDEVVWAADGEGLLSDEHFSVDGTLIEAAARLKSFRPRDAPAPPSTDDDPGNPSVDFRGERRSNETHASTTDPEARLLRKGPGKEARMAFLGHALTGTATGCRWTSRSAWPRARRSGMRCRSSWTGCGHGATGRARWGPTAATTPGTVSRTSAAGG